MGGTRPARNRTLPRRSDERQKHPAGPSQQRRLSGHPVAVAYPGGPCHSTGTGSVSEKPVKVSTASSHRAALLFTGIAHLRDRREAAPEYQADPGRAHRAAGGHQTPSLAEPDRQDRLCGPGPRDDAWQSQVDHQTPPRQSASATERRRALPTPLRSSPAVASSCSVVAPPVCLIAPSAGPRAFAGLWRPWAGAPRRTRPPWSPNGGAPRPSALPVRRRPYALSSDGR